MLEVLQVFGVPGLVVEGAVMPLSLDWLKEMSMPYQVFLASLHHLLSCVLAKFYNNPCCVPLAVWKPSNCELDNLFVCLFIGCEQSQLSTDHR